MTPAARADFRARLRTLGLTQRLLARRLDVTESAVSMWVSGAQTPSLKRAVQIESITGWEPRNWLDGEVKPGAD